ncbi:MAG: RNA 2'-phosphotransferase [Micrococcales bacterium]|nr:RNA 2'-phosphotransferase [Micrococcales bacterium]
MTDLVAASKHLAFVLRHDPASVGLVLDPHGWVDVTDLLAALAAHGHRLSVDQLDRLVDDRVVTGDKRRFERRGTRIRARHGHSVEVTWDGPPTTPPALLYHGTVARFLPAIRVQGLRPGQRRWVHLSDDPAAAADVGARRGCPVVLRVDAAAMHAAGHEFYRSGSVWLTASVPPACLHEDTPPSAA